MLKFSDYTKRPVIKQLNENVVQKGNTLTVTFTYDISMDVIEEYRKKVKSENDQNLLVQFSGAIIAEKMIKYTLDQYLTVDNIPSDAFINTSHDEEGTAPEVTQSNTESEQPTTEAQPEEPKAEEPAKEETPKKEEEEEESNYLNLYTTTGNQMSSGFKIPNITQKSKKDAKVGLYEGLTDKDIS